MEKTTKVQRRISGERLQYDVGLERSHIGNRLWAFECDLYIWPWVINCSFWRKMQVLIAPDPVSHPCISWAFVHFSSMVRAKFDPTQPAHPAGTRRGPCWCPGWVPVGIPGWGPGGFVHGYGPGPNRDSPLGSPGAPDVIPSKLVAKILSILCN